MMTKKKQSINLVTILLHILGWFCFLIYPFILGVPFKEDIFIRIFLHTVLLSIFFYSNFYLLVPKLLTKGKTGWYVTSVVIIIACIVYFNYWFYNLFSFDIRAVASGQGGNMPLPPPAPAGADHHHTVGFAFSQELKRFTRPLFSSLFILAVSVSSRLLSDWFENEKKKKELENENLISELSFLKSQVSPHFLFNTLNNIYSLSLSNSEKTSSAIMKLSQLLRYMLYESDVKQVSLSKEVEYISNYVELQKIRLRKEVIIETVYEGNFDDKTIAPMLLIPFVENAFKHGVDYSIDSYIKIVIKIEDDKLNLMVENSKSDKTIEKDKDSGIGLVNVERRLKLLYPGNHQLNIRDYPNVYKVELTLNLNK